MDRVECSRDPSSFWDFSQSGVQKINTAEERQMLGILAETSKDIKTLLILVKDLTVQQEKADQRALQQLSQIAHKR